MMIESILPVLLSYMTPEYKSIQQVRVLRCRETHNETTKIAGAFREAPGPVHGADPHDEIHDYGLPANKEAGNGYPSSDPYNDTLPNDRDHPYKPY